MDLAGGRRLGCDDVANCCVHRRCGTPVKQVKFNNIVRIRMCADSNAFIAFTHPTKPLV